MKSASDLPLIRLSSINPFIIELGHRDIDAASLLQACGLPRDTPASSDLFVAPIAIYDFVERSAKIAEDLHLGYKVGTQLNLQDWEPIALATAKAGTIGELLSYFTIYALEHSSATSFYLNTTGQRSIFGFERSVTSKRRLGQIDAFYLGFMSRLLLQATGDSWDSSAVLFKVADPDAIPPTPEHLRIATGDNLGIQIEFPTGWLFKPFVRSAFAARLAESDARMPRSSILDAMHHALRPHLHEPDLTIDRAAEFCGHDSRKLAQRLREQGTTIGKEIAKLREQRAGRELAETNRRISDIAHAVGFTDPTVFSRAFKKWSGMPPQEYRRRHRSPERPITRDGK
jgi:AraC-like DNA-binding protein